MKHKLKDRWFLLNWPLAYAVSVYKLQCLCLLCIVCCAVQLPNKQLLKIFHMIAVIAHKVYKQRFRGMWQVTSDMCQVSHKYIFSAVLLSAHIGRISVWGTKCWPGFQASWAASWSHPVLRCASWPRWWIRDFQKREICQEAHWPESIAVRWDQAQVRTAQLGSAHGASLEAGPPVLPHLSPSWDAQEQVGHKQSVHNPDLPLHHIA